jgi:DNA-directed RNA polymerase subunit RPC12/RpoP
MEALDGNAIAGPLQAVYGVEMTDRAGRCRHCGTGSRIAELAVYVKAPGMVVRCRHCGSVVMVLVSIRGEPSAHLDGFSLDAPPAAA